jgi:hypothetical protein
LDADQWIDKHIRPRGEKAVHGANAFVSVIEELGGRIEVASTQGSIYGAFRSQNGTRYYPLHLSSDNRISISFHYLLKRPGLLDVRARKELYDVMLQAVGPLSTANLQGYPGFPVDRLAEEEVREKFAQAASKLIAAAAVD